MIFVSSHKVKLSYNFCVIVSLSFFCSLWYIVKLLDLLHFAFLFTFLFTGDGRTKTPLSPTVAGSEPHPFSMSHGLGGSSIQLMESSRQSLGVYHSYSVGSLGQMQFSSGMWKPSRGQTTLQSRRSQSREDLSSSLADIHVPKV